MSSRQHGGNFVGASQAGGIGAYHGSPLMDSHKYQQQRVMPSATAGYYTRPNSSATGGVSDLSPTRRSSMRRRQMSAGARSAHNSRPASPDPRQMADYMETPWGPQYPSGQWLRGYPAAPAGVVQEPPPAHRAVSAGNLYDRGDGVTGYQPEMMPAPDLQAPLAVDAYGNSTPSHLQQPYQRGAPVCSGVPDVGMSSRLQQRLPQMSAGAPTYVSPQQQLASSQRRSKSVERVIDNSQMPSSTANYASSYGGHQHNLRQSLLDPNSSGVVNSSAAWYDPYATLPRMPHDQQQQYRYSTLPRFAPRDIPPPSTSNLLMPHYYHHHHPAVPQQQQQQQQQVSVVPQPVPQPQAPSPPPTMMSDYNSSSPFLLELQNQISELTRECANLRSELDSVRERLASTMNSIRSFWSPELKKERQLRKEESARYSMLSEQFRLLQVDCQKKMKSSQQQINCPYGNNCGVAESSSPILDRVSAFHRTTPTNNNSPSHYVATNANQCCSPVMNSSNRVVTSSGMYCSPHGYKSMGGVATAPPQTPPQKRLMRIQELEQRLSQYEAGLLQPSQSGGCQPWEVEALRAERDRLLNEFQGTRKTVDDLEMRLERMNEQLTQRDENIQRLLEMLNNRSAKEQAQSVAENELLQARLTESYNRIRQLEAQLTDRTSDVVRLQQEATNLSALANRHQTQSSSSVEAQLRDSKIALLEREVKTVTEELSRCRMMNQQLEKRVISASAGMPLNSQQTAVFQDKELELMRSQEKVLKQRVEALRVELAAKETEVLSMKSKVETLESQMTDQSHHVAFLKDQVSAKESQQAVMQSDLEAAQERLKERDGQLDKKGKVLQQLTAERRKFESEAAELRDHVDIKDKKIAVLQKKVDSLEDMLRDKDGQLTAVRQRLVQLQNEHAASGSAIAMLEQRLDDREKKLAAISDELASCEGDFKAEITQLQTVNHDLKKRVESLQSELEMTKTSLNLARDECDSVKNMAGQQQERLRELDRQLIAAQQTVDKLRSEASVESRDLSDQVTRLTNDGERLNSEVTRLRSENEKIGRIILDTQETLKLREERIKTLEKEVTDAVTETGKARSLADQRAATQAATANDSLAIKERETKLSSEIDSIKGTLAGKQKRIEELESALTEALAIQAQREVAVSQDLSKFDQSLKQGKAVNEEVDRLRQRQQELSTEVNRLMAEITDRDRQVYELTNERNRQEEQILEMKQEALVAAICEKDANIALFELTAAQAGGRPNPKVNSQMTKLTKEKEDIQRQLKDLGEQRAKLAQKHTQQLQQLPMPPNQSSSALDRLLSHSSSTSSTNALTMTASSQPQQPSSTAKQLPPTPSQMQSQPQHHLPPTPSQMMSSQPSHPPPMQNRPPSSQPSHLPPTPLELQNQRGQMPPPMQQHPSGPVPPQPQSMPPPVQQQQQLPMFGRRSPSPSSRVTDLSSTGGGFGQPQGGPNTGGFGLALPSGGGGMVPSPSGNSPLNLIGPGPGALNMSNAGGQFNMASGGAMVPGMSGMSAPQSGGFMGGPTGGFMGSNTGGPMNFNMNSNMNMGGMNMNGGMSSESPLQLTAAHRGSITQAHSSTPFQTQQGPPSHEPQFTIPGRRGGPPPMGGNDGQGFGDNSSQTNRRGQQPPESPTSPRFRLGSGDGLAAEGEDY